MDEEIIELLRNERNKADILARGSTEINLIDSILANAIKKLKLFLAFPMLVQEEGTVLKEVLSKAERQKFKALIEPELFLRSYGEDTKGTEDDIMFFSYNDNNYEILFNSYKADPNLEPNDTEKRFYSLINKLYCNPNVVRLSEKLYTNLPGESRYVIGVIDQLKNVMVSKMKESPLEEQEKEKQLSDMIQYSEWAKDELAVLSRKFAIAMNKQSQKLGEKCKEADRIVERTDAILAHSNDMTDFLARTSENKMVWERKKSDYVQESLFAEAKKLDAEFDYIFLQNLTKEKNLRVKRYKTEAQLIAILKKYDVDIRERDKAYKELLTIFNEEQKQLTEIREQFETQAVDYYALMDEKEEYERTQWEEKLYAIQKSMAARRIQRYYRHYVALCQSAGFVRFKKRGKGKKKK